MRANPTVYGPKICGDPWEVAGSFALMAHLRQDGRDQGLTAIVPLGVVNGQFHPVAVWTSFKIATIDPLTMRFSLEHCFTEHGRDQVYAMLRAMDHFRLRPVVTLCAICGANFPAAGSDCCPSCLARIDREGEG